MSDAVAILGVGLIFLFAGTVKGVVGFGLPIISLGLLTATLGLPQAMALMLIPAFVTNLWQALAGGQSGTIVARIWPFLGMVVVTVWIGAIALSYVEGRHLSALLGCLMVLYALVSLARVSVTVPPGRETLWGLGFGVVNGILAGMTGAFVFPGVLYLRGIGLSRDQLIQAMGMLFMMSTLALAVSLAANGFLTLDFGLFSAVAVIPSMIGMTFGQRIRSSLSDTMFQRLFFAGLIVLGGYIVLRAQI